MLARLNSTSRFVAIATLALATATPAAAQGTQTDGRWQAWLGCWSPAGSLVRVVGRSTGASVVCVVPASPASAVDVVTISNGKILDRTHVDADGQPHAIAKDGCTGWQTAKWAPSARRVYLKSEFNCNGAPVTRVSAVYAMAGSGDWMDIQGMRVDKNNGVKAVRYREAVDAGELPAEITQALPARSMARRAAMLAVTASPSLHDVEEASRELDPAVVSTWLVEAQKLSVERPEPLNAKQLVQLADAGVPGSVIDVMVGLAYPDAFAVNPATSNVARQNADSAFTRYATLGSYSLNPLIGFDRFGFPIYASESALMYGCSPFMYGPYNGWNPYNSIDGCQRYGYGFINYPGSGYGFGAYPFYGGNYGGYYGGYYGAGVPIVVPKGTGTEQPHGRVVNGKGYSQGTSGSSSATGRSDQSSSGSSQGSGSSSSSSPPPPPPRTAQPKKP